MTRKPRQGSAKSASMSARKRRSVELRLDPESAQQLQARLSSAGGQALLDELGRSYARAALDRLLKESESS
jgi:hypothetical protein